MSYKCCNKSTERLLPWYTVDHVVKATDISFAKTKQKKSY